MPDIGDLVTPTLTVDPADGTTVASLQIAAPDGTVTAGTGETSADSGATWTADLVTLTAAGMWVLTWTVTGTGAGVQHQRLVVAPDPTPVPSPTALATISDLIMRTGSLTEAQIARAPALLADSSALIRSYTGQTFTTVAGDSVVLRPVGTHLRLPQRPVTAVTSVTALGGGVIPDLPLPAGTWTWDGVDLVDVSPLDTNIWLSLPAAWGEVGWPVDTYRVVYSHGYAAAPADVVAVCCRMTLAVLLAPTMTEGLVSERIGQYGYQYGQAIGAASPGATVRLTSADMRDLRRYRRTAGTVQLRVR